MPKCECALSCGGTNDHCMSNPLNFKVVQSKPGEELTELDKEIMYLEIKLKNLHEQRRELINRFNLNKVTK